MEPIQRSTLLGSGLPLRRLGWRGERRAPCQMTDRYLTVQEVADLVRCEHRVVRKAIHRGELEAAMIGGRWLIREEAVQVWFEAKRVQRPSPPKQHRAGSRASTTEGQQSVARLRAMREGT